MCRSGISQGSEGVGLQVFWLPSPRILPRSIFSCSGCSKPHPLIPKANNAEIFCIELCHVDWGVTSWEKLCVCVCLCVYVFIYEFHRDSFLSRAGFFDSFLTFSSFFLYQPEVRTRGWSIVSMICMHKSHMTGSLIIIRSFLLFLPLWLIYLHLFGCTLNLSFKRGSPEGLHPFVSSKSISSPWVILLI